MSLSRQIYVLMIAAVLVALAPMHCVWAQSSGNPFARSVPTPPPAPATPQASAVPPPPMPPKLFESDESEMKRSFESLALVAIAGSQAVLKSADAVYYLRNGDYFSYEGVRVKVKIDGNRLQLFSEKGNDEVYISEVGNGVVTSTKPLSKDKKDKDKDTKISAAATPPAPATSPAPAPATPGVKK